jgi:hypothetical protein
MKLGKLDPVNDPHTLQLSNYLNLKTLPAAPAKYAYGNNISAWGIMNNDKINNCTCAAAGHLIMEWTAANGDMVTPTDQDIINAYAAITGYNPATGANDGGSGVIEVLGYWRNTGIADHKILAYAALEPKNHQHIMQSVYLFGGCYVGLSLPTTAKTQLVWDVTATGTQGDGAKGSWGGHVVPVIGYDANGLTIVTWGAIKTMTWAFWDTYSDESYAIISLDFTTTKVAPNGFNLASLRQDLKKIAS